MTYQTRTVEVNCTSTTRSAAESRVASVTLIAMPWDEPKPARAIPPRPEERTQITYFGRRVAKPRTPIAFDPIPDEEAYAAAMLALADAEGRDTGLPRVTGDNNGGVPKSGKKVDRRFKPRPGACAIEADVLRTIGDRRMRPFEIRDESTLTIHQIGNAIQRLRRSGRVAHERAAKFVFIYRVTPAGREWLAAWEAGQ
jgi:hypothetical protein